MAAPRRNAGKPTDLRGDDAASTFGEALFRFRRVLTRTQPHDLSKGRPGVRGAARAS